MVSRRPLLLRGVDISHEVEEKLCDLINELNKHHVVTSWNLLESSELRRGQPACVVSLLLPTSKRQSED